MTTPAKTGDWKKQLSFWRLLAFALIAYVGVWAFFIVHSPLSYDEMDLNKDGWISFGEAEHAGFYGTRLVTIAGKSCTEYFSRKDGTALKVVCERKPGKAP